MENITKQISPCSYLIIHTTAFTGTLMYNYWKIWCYQLSQKQENAQWERKAEWISITLIACLLTLCIAMFIHKNGSDALFQKGIKQFILSALGWRVESESKEDCKQLEIE